MMSFERNFVESVYYVVKNASFILLPTIINAICF